MKSNEMIRSDLQDDSMLNSEESEFKLASIESYYERNVLGIGRSVLEAAGVTVQE